MAWVWTVVGAALLVLVLVDIFHTLWHPMGEGRVTRTVMASAWRLSRGSSPTRRLASMGGPLSMLAVVLTWTALVVAGWTLIYWPRMPEGFSFDPGMQPQLRGDLVDALYLSLVTVATLGFGDIVPQEPWLRAVTPVQALLGFVLLTAAVSWVLQVYPALGRRRALAGRLDLLRRTDVVRNLPGLDAAATAHLLHSVAADVVQVRVDLTQYSETYYFRDGDPRSALPAMLPYAERLSDAGSTSGALDVRLAAGVLAASLDDLAEALVDHIRLSGATRHEVLARYAEEHGFGDSD